MANRTSSITLELLDNVSRPAKTVAEALAAAEREVRAVAAAMGEDSAVSDRFVSALSRLKLSADDIAVVRDAFVDFTRVQGIAATATEDLTKEQIGSIRNWETATLTSLRAVVRARESDERAIRGQLAAQRDLTAATTTALKAEAVAPRQGIAARGSHALGQLLPFAGPAIISAIVKGVEAATKIQAQDIQGGAAGIPAAERDAAMRQAIRLSAKYPNLDTAEILQTYRELRSVLPDSAEVPKMMEEVVKAKAAMAASGLDESGLVYGLKAAELLGKAKSPEELGAYLNAFVKAQQVEGKTIDAEGMFNFAQQLKAAAPNLSSRFVNTLGPLLLQELGANGGTAVQQFEKQILGGFQGNLHAAAKEFVAIGLANKDDFETTKTGEIKGLKHGHSVVGADIAEHDPDKWVYDVLVPALVKAGYTTTEEQIKELPRLFPNTNAANVVAKLLQQKDQWAAKAERIDKAQGTESLPDQMAGVGVAFAAFKTQLVDFIGVLDTPALKDLGAGLSFAATELGNAKIEIDRFAQAFPPAARAIADFGLAVGAIAGGWLTAKLFTGFGLTGSATALTASAAELSAAAAALSGGAAAEGTAGVAAAEAVAGVSAAAVAGIAAALAAAGIAAQPGVEKAIKAGNPAFGTLGGDLPYFPPGLEIRRGGIGSDAVAGHTAGALGPQASLDAATRIDTSSLNKINETSSAVTRLGAAIETVGNLEPTINTSALESAIRRIRSAIADLNSLGSSLGGLTPSLNSTIRNGFSYGGVGGE